MEQELEKRSKIYPHRENFQGRGNHLGKHPEVGVRPVCLKNSKEAGMVGAERVRGKRKIEETSS